MPTLVLDAASEELWDTTANGQAVYETLKQKGIPCKYVLLTGKHYGAYESKGYFKGQAEATKWFQRHLMTEQEQHVEQAAEQKCRL